MVPLTEAAGDTLRGVIDGANKTYSTSHAMQLDYNRVSVYLNGVKKVAALDDGYTLESPFSFAFKEAPLPGDTVAVEYSTGENIGGGADGGVPQPFGIESLRPQPLEASSDCPCPCCQP